MRRINLSIDIKSGKSDVSLSYAQRFTVFLLSKIFENPLAQIPDFLKKSGILLFTNLNEEIEKLQAQRIEYLALACMREVSLTAWMEILGIQTQIYV